MNKAEKDTIKAHLNAEQKALQELEKAYKQAKKDCQERIKALNARTDMQNLQTIVHQRKYQQVLLKQIDGVLNDLQTHTYKSANEFFQSAYENGYIGSMYELTNQGIPLTIPISRKKMLTAIQTDSKISKDYYLKQGLTVQNIRTLKQQIAQEATRGIASGKSWLEVANSLSIQRYFSISLSDAMRICRTEGNRINQQARLDAGDEAVKAGCDLLKQWDATMDDKTRPWHREADGQIVEWDESFTVMGEKLKAPSIGGSAKNVINCRCQLLKRPRWALDEEELERLKKRAEYFGLDKSQSFEEYKQKFLTLPSQSVQEQVVEKSKTVADYKKEIQDLSEEYASNRRKWMSARVNDDFDAVSKYRQRNAEINDLISKLTDEMNELVKIEKAQESVKLLQQFKKHSEDHSIPELLSFVNPNYKNGGKLYHRNCGNCCLAVDMQFRGYDVEALPRDGMYIGYWKNLWTDFYPKGVSAKRKKTAIAEIKAEVQSWGDGARGAIFVQWDNSMSGHYFNVVNDGGIVKFIDGQDASSSCESYFLDAKPSSILYGRTDNLPISDRVGGSVKNRGDSK